MQPHELIAFAAFISSVIFSGLGILTLPMLIKSEIFPTNVKAFAMLTTDIVFTAGNAVLSKVYPLCERNYGIEVPYLFFAICTCVGTVFVIYFVPETKGKSLEDIQKELYMNGKIEVAYEVLE